MKKETKKIVGVVGIIKKGDKYLLGLETKDSPFRGKWRLLGGKVEAGETFEQTLHREIQEEAQIKIKIIKYLAKVIGDNHRIPIHVFLAKWTSEKIKTKYDEHNRIELFTKEQIAAMDCCNMTKRVLKRFEDVPFK